jgi:hypothetical protein
MSNFFTDGRLALVAALQEDPELAALVKTWFEFGPGLSRRHQIQPAHCPALSVAPAESAEGWIANVEREIPQVLRIEVATDGQDVQPCEEMVALVLACVHASNETCLGLASAGLTGLRTVRIRWSALPGEDAARLTWTATIEVELLWRVTS